MALLRKKPAPAPEPTPEPELEVKAGGKGRPTPTRREAQAARRGRPLITASDPKEARRQAREERRKRAAVYREGMMSGDVSKLPPRERVPERVLARDLIDARRNFGPVFLAVFAVYFVVTLLPIPVGVRLVAFYVMFAAFLLQVVDGVMAGRSVQRRVREQHPGSRVPVRFYTFQRALMPGRWRTPRPRRSARGWLHTYHPPAR